MMNIEKLPDPAKLPQEFILDAFADPASVRDVVRGEYQPASASHRLTQPHPALFTASLDPLLTWTLSPIFLFAGPPLPAPTPPFSRPQPTNQAHVIEQKGILHTIFFHRYFAALIPQTHEVLDLTLPYVAEPEFETLIDQRTTALVRELDSSASKSRGGGPAAGVAIPTSSAPTGAAAAAAAAAAAGAATGPPSSPRHHYAQSLPQQGRAALAGLLGGGSAAGGGGGGGGGRGQVSVQFMEKTTSRRRKMWGRADEEVCWETWTVRVTVAEPRTESGKAIPPSSVPLHLRRRSACTYVPRTLAKRVESTEHTREATRARTLG